MESTHTLPQIYEQIRAYLKTRDKLLKLEAADRISSISAEVVTNLAIAFFLVIVFLIFSLSMALLAAQVLHSKWEGFCCITIIYLLLALMIGHFKARLKNNLIHKVIRTVFSKAKKGDTDQAQQDDKDSGAPLASIKKESAATDTITTGSVKGFYK